MSAAASFFAAAEAGDRPAMQRALVDIAPVLGPAIRRTLQRQDSLVRSCRLEAAQRWKIACACADRELVKYKYLRELFHAVAAEPELGARALAERIGLLAVDANAETARRAEQYVWKLRERVQQKLADHFETLERIR